MVAHRSCPDGQGVPPRPPSAPTAPASEKESQRRLRAGQAHTASDERDRWRQGARAPRASERARARQPGRAATHRAGDSRGEEQTTRQARAPERGRTGAAKRERAGRRRGRTRGCRTAPRQHWKADGAGSRRKRSHEQEWQGGRWPRCDCVTNGRTSRPARRVRTGGRQRMAATSERGRHTARGRPITRRAPLPRGTCARNTATAGIRYSAHRSVGRTPASDRMRRQLRGLWCSGRSDGSTGWTHRR